MQYIATVQQSSTAARTAPSSTTTATTSPTTNTSTGPRPLTADIKREIELSHQMMTENKKMKINDQYLEEVVYKVGQSHPLEK